MSTLTVGDTFTTSKSNVTGTIKEIHERSYGSVLLLDVDGQDRFTTIK